jgi:hypothetical protein
MCAFLPYRILTGKGSKGSIPTLARVPVVGVRLQDLRASSPTSRRMTSLSFCPVLRGGGETAATVPLVAPHGLQGVLSREFSPARRPKMRRAMKRSP